MLFYLLSSVLPAECHSNVHVYLGSTKDTEQSSWPMLLLSLLLVYVLTLTDLKPPSPPQGLHPLSARHSRGTDHHCRWL